METARCSSATSVRSGPWTRPTELAEAGEALQPLVALVGREHVAVKFSGLYGVSDAGARLSPHGRPPVVDLVLEAYGPSRLMWGSDFAPLLDFVTFIQAADTRLLGGCSPAEVERVMGGNLLRILEGR